MAALADAKGIAEAEAEAPAEQSVTAMDYINRQLELEKEARELMPYSFETCTYSMGPLRQPVYACKQHSPEGGALCYSCSISCHGECDLIELFNKRHIQCDCGTTRFPNSPCTLRNNITSDVPAETNKYCHNYQGRFCACDRDYDVAKETGTMYQCLLGDACNEDWFHDACIVGEKYHERETEMEDSETLGNGELNTSRSTDKNTSTSIANGTEAATDSGAIPPVTDIVCDIAPEVVSGDQASANAGDEDENDYEDEDRPDGFPAPSTFTNFICWLCVAKNPWLRNYAGTPGFLPAVIKKDAIDPETTTTTTTIELPTTSSPQTIESATLDISSSKKRKVDDEDLDSSMTDAPAIKRINKPLEPDSSTTTIPTKSNNDPPPSSSPPSSFQPPSTLCTLPSSPSPTPSNVPFSLFLTSPPHSLPPQTFCQCPIHLPLLCRFPVLTSQTEEPTYEPPLSRSASPTGSHHSILDMGERALSTMDRVKAIEGVMAYNHMKEKVREFLKPFAEGGGVVGAEDVRAYFEKLREGLAGGAAGAAGAGSKQRGGGGGGEGSSSENRKEQSGY